MYEKEVEKINGARFNLEQQIIALEGAALNMEVFQGMRAGATALEASRQGVDVDNVDDIMADIQEEMGIHNEIGEAIARPIDDGLEDDDLLKELEELEAEDLEAELLDVPDAVPAVAAPAAAAPDLASLPAVPTSAVEVEGGADEETLAELRALEASMLA
mmetsp:Transcript_10957/g.33360  ORF Transcript_10957/g.33360 Transcript_10957/m.33360 type:complete len:160 (+) Transcript_10957:591-1070(+)